MVDVFNVVVVRILVDGMVIIMEGVVTLSHSNTRHTPDKNIIRGLRWYNL